VVADSVAVEAADAVADKNPRPRKSPV